MKRRDVLFVISAAAALVAVPLTAQAQGGAEKSNRVHIVLQPGLQLFPIAVMKLQKLDKKHNIEVFEDRVAGPQATITRVQHMNFHVTFQPPTQALVYRSRDIDVVIGGSMSGFSHPVLVKNESKLKTWKDLKGATLGLSGGPAAAQAQVFRYEAKKYFDLAEADYIVRFGEAGLLGGQLERGDIDAALMVEPLASRYLSTGNFRSIGGLGDAFKTTLGNISLPYVNVMFNGKWAKENPDVAKRFLAALAESQKYLRENPQIWPQLAAEIRITDPKEIALLTQRVAPQMLSDWNQEVVAAQMRMLKEIAETIDPKELSFPVPFPEGSFTTDYAP